MSYLPSKNKVISENSSTAALNNGQVFTGTWTDVSMYDTVSFSVYTDQAGTIQAQFSPDGSNADSTISYAVAASTNEPHGLVVTKKYFRIVFTNDSGANQTFFRLQTIGGSQGPISSPLNSVIQQDADARVVRVVDFNLNVAESKYSGLQTVFKDGINPDIDSASVPEDIWDSGSAYTGFPISAAAAEVVSTDAGDTGTLYYSYLASDTSTSYVTASVTLNGTTPVALGHNVWRCNFMFYDTGADTTFNIGTISLYHTATPTNIFCTIRPAYSQSFCSAYTVPFGYKGYIDRITANVRGAATASVDGFFWWRPFGLSPRLRQAFNASFGSLYFDDIDYLFQIPARTDLIPRISFSSANNLEVQASYRLILVKD